MIPEFIYKIFLWASFPLASATFITLLFVTAPYGRHERRGWGLSISNRLGWILMESPSAVLFFLIFLIGSVSRNLTGFTFLLMWEAHYVHRAFIYPFQITDGKKSIPIIIMLMGIFFNLGNAYINASYIYEFSGGYPQSWLSQPRMIIGIAIFVAGFGINRLSDRTLRSLRTHSGEDYQIPYGGLFHFVSCPNYLGE
ncbi:MAG: 3-oxo-5-alpha-steroid 4-dehydrogenase, partial [candidate division Zixibacteria bacterium]|nr:3-oxo-5-alpha-steroid 4-dehydrogenase [candidate division Zixibacteria bacterium]NIS48870.1 3-oxo-5-alpha-steroid 4-dehydrogenase [candidate division Zixibacteria bacterium]NIU16949.1 3-oxo-5-alpha-steroid 4-dehydrogenase [candidate division Zixibacteria bacterium]NIV09102.1 3-oxo-5-alpha-steroid 4-dehydrogenase [candidate division Zixibacteria bacterium]NIW49948.1 3-oxo-5-alpha-steroid 4-dehydrogenase [Gammaproteobacteria bacterium]